MNRLNIHLVVTKRGEIRKDRPIGIDRYKKNTIDLMRMKRMQMWSLTNEECCECLLLLKSLGGLNTDFSFLNSKVSDWAEKLLRTESLSLCQYDTIIYYKTKL